MNRNIGIAVMALVAAAFQACFPFEVEHEKHATTAVQNKKAEKPLTDCTPARDHQPSTVFVGVQAAQKSVADKGA